jgi:hypothetical protein
MRTICVLALALTACTEGPGAGETNPELGDFEGKDGMWTGNDACGVGGLAITTAAPADITVDLLNDQDPGAIWSLTDDPAEITKLGAFTISGVAASYYLTLTVLGDDLLRLHSVNQTSGNAESCDEEFTR